MKDNNKEAVIWVDILDEDETISAAFEAVECFVGDSWLGEENNGFTIRDTAEARFLRRILFEMYYPTEEDALRAIREYCIF